MADPKSIVELAREYARIQHAGQVYAGSGDRPDAPYETHLAAVVAVLERFGITADTALAAAWLHDVIEDGETSYQQVAMMFPIGVANAVWAVTGVGENRKERNADAYAKIAGNPTARIVKLADRIANVEAGGERVEIYRKEHYQFQRALKGPRMDDVERAMWAHLDTLLPPLTA